MKSHILVFICITILCLPAVVFGAGGGAGDAGRAANPAFISLVGIPGINPNDPGLGNYINAIYRLAISLAALLAVVKIVIAGAKYMLDDIVTHKEEAKQDIWGAVTGLLVILSAVLILTTINSDLTHTDIIVDSVNLDDAQGDGTQVPNPDLTTAKSMAEADAMCDAVNQTCEKSYQLCYDYATEGTDCNDITNDFYKDVKAYCELDDNMDINCAYTHENLQDYIDKTVAEEIVRVCSELNNGSCIAYSCDLFKTYNQSCTDACVDSSSGVPDLPSSFNANFCVVPDNERKPLDESRSTKKYTFKLGWMRNPDVGTFVWSHSVGGKVHVTDGLTGLTYLVDCADITPSVCTE